MSIIFDWPRDIPWRPIDGKFGLTSISQLSQSPFTGSFKALLLQQVWKAELTFNNHSLADGIALQGFIEGLEGGANPVRMFDPWRTQPSLVSTTQAPFSDSTYFSDGTGFIEGWNLQVLNSAAKGSAYITVSGLPVSQPCFVRGDLISINGYLYQLRTGASSNASGQAMLWIQPGLRAGIAAGDAVNTSFPTSQMLLVNASDMVPRHQNLTTGFTLTFMENVQ